jgi:hypothetical protein
VVYALSRSVVVRKDTSVGAIATASGVTTLLVIPSLEINQSLLLPLNLAVLTVQLIRR